MQNATILMRSVKNVFHVLHGVNNPHKTVKAALQNKTVTKPASSANGN